MAGIWRWKTAQYAERKWWQRYLKNKEVIPYLTWKNEYWNGLLSKCRHYFSIEETDSILDAGCGPAGIFVALKEQNITAFDPLIESYEHDLPHFNKSMYPNVHFENIGLEKFTNKQQFDVVFCMNAINHVHDIQKSVERLISFSKSNAHIIITIDAHTYTFFKTIFRLLPGDILHPHQYDLNEYQLMFTTRECTIVATELLKHEFLFDHYMLIIKKN